jgi:small nuclear ribonucleoprotein (snRNP)-like protein
MKNLKWQIVLISIFTLVTSFMYAQTTLDSIQQGQTVLIKMNNGEEYQGRIHRQDSQIIVLYTENGEIKLKASNVKLIETYDYTGKFSFPNPHDTRYFFGPSGMPIKKGKGYYQNILVTTNFVNYGITKNFSIGGGFEFLSTVFGSPIWFLTPKVGFDISEKFHAGGGFIMAGFAAEGTATLAYGVVTTGDAESNASLGIGYGFSSGEVLPYPVIMVSGTHRVSRSIALLSENYIIPGGDGEAVYFGIQGIRILSKKNAFDVGVIIIPQAFDFIPALPYVGYARAF